MRLEALRVVELGAPEVGERGRDAEEVLDGGQGDVADHPIERIRSVRGPQDETRLEDPIRGVPKDGVRCVATEYDRRA